MVRAKLICAGDSHPGLVRKNNEDRVYSDVDRGIFLVIDGIGGQAAGEQAAGIAETRIRRRLERQTGTAEQRVREAITVANNEIFDVAQRHPDWQGMACVLTLALVEDGHATIGHVGDSRLYKIRGNEIRKLTHDHSPIGEREDAGELNESDAMAHPRRNEVYRDVGSELHTPDDPDFIEVRRVSLEADSALLLCSDGLSDQVPSPKILRTVLANAKDPEKAVAELIEAANLAGGKDNVSVLIVMGEQFAAAAASAIVEPAPRGRFLVSRTAFFIYGLLLAAMAALLLIPQKPWSKPVAPAVRVSSTQILAVGPSAPYKTIAEAMAKAMAGDIVEVAGGEYRETVRLKDGVTVRSRIPGDAILRAAPSTASPYEMAVWGQFVRNTRVEGFRILADPQLPLSAGVVLDGADAEVTDMEISGVKVGVRVQGSRVLMRANSIHGSLAEGISIDQQSQAWLSHNVILDNGRDKVTPHVDLDAALAQVTLVGNVFRTEKDVRVPSKFSRETLLEFNYFLGPSRRPGARRK